MAVTTVTVALLANAMPANWCIVAATRSTYERFRVNCLNSYLYILFINLQGSWQGASKKQREKLLELIRRLAEDDKEGIMANKVLSLLWNLAKSEDVTTDIMDQALAAHIKILDYSCSQVCVQVGGEWIGRLAAPR